MSAAQGSPPRGEIEIRVTGSDMRLRAAPSLHWGPPSGDSSNCIKIDDSVAYQEILGFGGAFTDAACYNFNRLSTDARESLFHELFHPSRLGLSVCRICVGSSDYATELYSYDEGAPDPELARFSIDHDRRYVLPMLQLARRMNPDLFLLASPWSPPGWMKVNGSMRGGLLEKKQFPVYARYLVKFLQAYEQAGVKVNAITVQNEVDTDQDGRMPASLWGEEYETGFVSGHLGPAIAANKLDTKIWIIDHNYNLWGRAVCELDDPDTNKYVDGVAWHGYLGEPTAMTRVHQAHPEKNMYWTEGGPSYTAPDYALDWTQWGTTYAGILRNWAKCIIGWNLALDEHGKPNIGPFDCGGIVTINSQSAAVTRSGQYYAFAHYATAARRGAKRIESSGTIEGVSHVALAGPGDNGGMVLTNTGDAKTVRFQFHTHEAETSLPANSISTLTWKL